jgi:hypothetical protein
MSQEKLEALLLMTTERKILMSLEKEQIIIPPWRSDIRIVEGAYMKMFRNARNRQSLLKH